MYSRSRPLDDGTLSLKRNSTRKKRVAPKIVARGSSHPTSIFNMPPKKIIRAKRSYTAKRTGELGFKIGDYFYVIGELKKDGFIEAINPVLKVRGLVPFSCFEDIKKVANPKEYDEFGGSHQSSDEDDRYKYQNTITSPGRYDDDDQDSYYDQKSPKSFGREPRGDKSQYNYENRSANNSRSKHKDFSDQNYSRNDSVEYDDYVPDRYHSKNTVGDYYDTIKTYRSTETSNHSGNYSSSSRRDHNDSNHSSNGRHAYPSRNQQSGQSEYSDDQYEDDEELEDESDAFDALTKMNSSDAYIVNAEIVAVDESSVHPTEFVINISYNDGQTNVIRREYKQVYDMNVELVKLFSDEAGRDGEPRLIPFLQPPSQISSKDAQLVKKDLCRYFNEFFNLTDAVLDSETVTNFFKPKRGDDNTKKKYFDVADTLLSLLDDVKVSSELIIKVVSGSDIQIIKETDDITFDEFLSVAETKLKTSIRDLLFLDECDNLVPLYDDEDFNLIKALRKFKVYVE